MRRKYDMSFGSIVSQTILVLGLLVMLIPFVWMFLTSFKTFPETMQIPIKWLPSKFSFTNYLQVLQRLNFSKYYLNTIFVTVIITSAQVFFCSLAAYAFARLEFPGRDIIFFAILSVLMVPIQMTLIPNYILMNNLGWIDTFLALTVPHFASAYGTFFLRQFFMTIPGELEDSAKIDGCSYFRIYWNILLPLCGSAIAAFAIFTVLWAWNDLLWPLIMTSSDAQRLLSVGIATLQGQHATEYHLLMAASVMATVPMIIMFIVGQKNFISGIAITGIKA
jgi:multiple sugar transport system permease protein